ncbi:MAG: hypothetical protein U0Q22_13865 [Acidimicrobiales bacterium]
MARTSTSPPSLTGTTLICLGASCTVLGGLGVGFRAAGLGYLGQSLASLAVGVVMLFVGLHIAANVRRSLLTELRFTPIRATYAPEQPAGRVRVHAWTTAPLELGPARAA